MVGYLKKELRQRTNKTIEKQVPDEKINRNMTISETE